MAEIIEKGSKSKAKVPKFNPEGSGYDYASAKTCGLGPDGSGHWSSRCPSTGQLLKGRDHETWNKLVAEEDAKGYKVYKRNGKYYSKKVKQTKGR